MAAINWESMEDRTFQTGVDRAVFYTHAEGYSGIAWRGLVSVTDGEQHAKMDPLHINGFAAVHDYIPGDYEGTIEALSYPKEFAWFANGEAPMMEGFYATGQDRLPFDFTYRVRTGSALDADASDYIIHFVYNAMVLQNNSTAATITDTTEPNHFRWEFYCTALENGGRGRPTAHYTLNSKEVHPFLLGAVEGLLYGYEVGPDPRMPSVDEIVDILETEPPLAFTNHALNPSFENDATWTAFAAEAVQSTQWASTGTHSLEVEPTSSSNMNSFVYIGEENSLASYGTGNWVFGAVKVAVMEKVDAPSSPLARRMVVVVRDADNLETRYLSNAAPTSPGVYTLTLEPFMVAPGTTFLSVQLWNGTTNSGPAVYFDDLVLISATPEEKDEKWADFQRLPNLYFDGSSKYGRWGHGKWSGEENNSESLYYSFGL